MDNAKQHWPILRKLGTDLENKVREFLVIGGEVEGVIVATEDGLGYWLGEIKFGLSETKTATNPTLLDLPGLVSMAQGDSHILLLNKRGEIYSMGKNDYGQLGLGTVDQETYFSPQFIFSPHKFTSVRCDGNGHSLALTEDGKVWAWGWNNFGQVGVPCSTKSLPSPRQIPELNPHRVVAIECGGGGHSLALTDQGEVYGLGWNEYGQLGDKSWSTPHIPTQIPTPSPVQSMAAGYRHTLLLTQTGEVYACGWNEFGQLGLSNLSESSFHLSKVAGLPPISQIASHYNTNLSIAMSPNHRCFVWGELAVGNSISTPWELDSNYSTVESPLSFFSTSRSTPHSVTLPARECFSRTDLTTRTESGFDSVQNHAPTYRILDKMFNNPDFSPDIRFLVGDQIILAHRCVLQSSSSHFRQLFFSPSADLNPLFFVTPQFSTNFSRHTTNPSEPDSTPHGHQCTQVTISIPDHSYPAFHAYLRFLYLGILEVSPEHLADLFSLSVAYLESDLQQLCLSHMRTTLSPATCCLYYPLTYLHSLPELSAFQQELIQFISTNFQEVIRTAAYQSMDAELCKKLTISMSNLHIN